MYCIGDADGTGLYDQLANRSAWQIGPRIRPGCLSPSLGTAGSSVIRAPYIPACNTKRCAGIIPAQIPAHSLSAAYLGLRRDRNAVVRRCAVWVFDHIDEHWAQPIDGSTLALALENRGIHPNSERTQHSCIALRRSADPYIPRKATRRPIAIPPAMPTATYLPIADPPLSGWSGKPTPNVEYRP